MARRFEIVAKTVSELQEKYPSKWIAILNQKVVVVLPIVINHSNGGKICHMKNKSLCKELGITNWLCAIRHKGRAFPFYRTTIANETGTYEFIVPYSTEGPLQGKEYTQFDTMPTGPYTIKIGAATKKVKVTEIDVIVGRVVRVE